MPEAMSEPLSGCCNAPVDKLASLPLCVKCNGLLTPQTHQPFPGRHKAGHNERCGLPPHEIGRKVRLLKDVWDDGADHHPPGYLAREGEVLVVRSFDKGHEMPVCVSHEHVTTRSFRVALAEIEGVE